MQSDTQFQDILFEAVDSYGGLKQIRSAYDAMSRLMENSELPDNEGIAFIFALLTERFSDQIDKLDTLLDKPQGKNVEEIASAIDAPVEGGAS